MRGWFYPQEPPPPMIPFTERGMLNAVFQKTRRSRGGWEISSSQLSRMKLKCAIVPINIRIPSKTYASVFICCVKGFRIISVMQFTRGRCLTRLVWGVLGKFLDPWTLGPLSSWRLILLDSSQMILSYLKKIWNDEWWCTKVCHRSMYVVKKIVICQLHPPSYLYSVGLGCVVAVDASSFARDCL